MRVVVVGTEGRLRDGLVAGLKAAGIEIVGLCPECSDPFGAALGARAVVYLPARRLDEAGISSEERMRAALRAAHAPDVEVFVTLMPLDGFEDELELLASDGVPYVGLRVPPLLEELGEQLDDGWLVVASDETVRTVAVDAVVEAVRCALETEEQGRVEELGRTPLPASVAAERAAQSAGKRLRVLSLWPPLARALRWVGRMLRRSWPSLGSARPMLPAHAD